MNIYLVKDSQSQMTLSIEPVKKIQMGGNLYALPTLQRTSSKRKNECFD